MLRLDLADQVESMSRAHGSCFSQDIKSEGLAWLYMVVSSVYWYDFTGLRQSDKSLMYRLNSTSTSQVAGYPLK